MYLSDVIQRSPAREPWAEGDKIPGNDPDFSRRTFVIEDQIEWIIPAVLHNRLRRGEQLSAWRFVQGHAFSLLLELVEFDESDPTLDVFSKERRWEQRRPDWHAHLRHFLPGYDRVAESAHAMLAYLDGNYAVPPEIKRVILALCSEA